MLIWLLLWNRLKETRKYWWLRLNKPHQIHLTSDWILFFTHLFTCLSVSQNGAFWLNLSRKFHLFSWDCHRLSEKKMHTKYRLCDVFNAQIARWNCIIKLKLQCVAVSMVKSAITTLCWSLQKNPLCRGYSCHLLSPYTHLFFCLLRILLSIPFPSLLQLFHIFPLFRFLVLKVFLSICSRFLVICCFCLFSFSFFCLIGANVENIGNNPKKQFIARKSICSTVSS